LIKNPDDIEKDCVKITREGELSVSFAVNKQNHKKVYDEFMPDETPDGDVSPVFVY
jgi:hypothetical protein